MSKATVQARYHLKTPPDGIDKTIQGFTNANLRAVYAGQIRRTAASLGRAIPPVTVTDPGVLSRIDAHSTQVAKSIPATVNGMLENQLQSMPDGLSDAEYAKRLQPFFDGVAQYNRDVLVPFSRDTALQMATRDFYQQNGIDTTWHVEPAETDSHDECLEAISQGEMSSDAAANYDFPMHQQCPHQLLATPPPDASVPAAADLWAG